jgi:hypothetical protein
MLIAVYWYSNFTLSKNGGSITVTTHAHVYVEKINSAWGAKREINYDIL